MPSPIHQYVINLVVNLPIGRGPAVLMNVAVWEHRAFNKYIFVVAKFTILTPLSLLSWCIHSFPVVGLKISSLPNFALRSPKRLFVWYLGKWSKTCSNSSEELSFVSSLFSSLDARTFRTIILHQWPLSTIYDTLSLTNSTPLTADTILCCTKVVFPIDDFRFLFHRNIIIPCPYSAAFVPANLLYTQ